MDFDLVFYSVTKCCPGGKERRRERGLSTTNGHVTTAFHFGKVRLIHLSSSYIQSFSVKAQYYFK